jgi:putative membrane protein
VLAVALAYHAMAAARRRPWPWQRTLSFSTGCVLLIAGWTGFSYWPPADFRTHMLQHLLIGMFAPLAIVLGAPVTLLLRTLPASGSRAVVRLLRSGVCRCVANPCAALALNVGGLLLLYLTPLYATTSGNPQLHLVVHIHFLLAGCLFAWVIAGPDPGPHRPSVPVRLALLGVAVAVHASLAQLMYAGLLIDVPVTAEQRRGGAELMYYIGDIAELFLAFALVASWHPARPRSRRPSDTAIPSRHRAPL